MKQFIVEVSDVVYERLKAECEADGRSSVGETVAMLLDDRFSPEMDEELEQALLHAIANGPPKPLTDDFWRRLDKIVEEA